MNFFGVVAYDLDFVTMGQLSYALHVQQLSRNESSGGRRLGEILRSLGYLSPAQVEKVLTHQRYLTYPLHTRLQIALEKPWNAA